MKTAENITQLTGNTPLVKISEASTNDVTVYGKLESQNPTFSVKDRLALSLIEAGEKQGLINKNTVIIEPTSGNTGIGLASICAQRGYRLILTMPKGMSKERMVLLKHFGAELELTPKTRGMNGAIDKALNLAKEYSNSFIPQQFKNKANPEIHYKTTGPEIWNDTDGEVDIFIAGVGTGGTLTGTARYLKEKNPEIKIVAVEPLQSSVLSGKAPGSHKIQGIGAGFIPDILDTELIDEVIAVNDDDAINMTRLLARKEGILAGISSGANILAAQQLAEKSQNAGKTIVTLICDTGERYISLWQEYI